MVSRDEQIRTAAILFRQAIEATDRSRLPITFSSFPRGSCGDAALLMGARLAEVGFGAFNYVLGERGSETDDSWSSHAWIEQHGLIVDITADQFPDAPGSVLVVRNSLWHGQFGGEVQNEAHFRVYDERTESTLEHAYREIARLLHNAA